ncbi:hypothetical protein Tsubulata_027859 [Turnera subulata]|uniref:Uncharacterized protein n=1 Tax=Turnera subulata TaxID=218843 RepID=A0A9Q0F522_9ROSI|nr:hypothetical protein Tsubulata_027859 [Turnera subulata]
MLIVSRIIALVLVSTRLVSFQDVECVGVELEGTKEAIEQALKEVDKDDGEFEEEEESEEEDADGQEEVEDDDELHWAMRDEDMRDKWQKRQKGKRILFGRPVWKKQKQQRDVKESLDDVILERFPVLIDVAPWEQSGIFSNEEETAVCFREYLWQPSLKHASNIYLTLLQIYLNPRKTTKNFEQRITSLVSSQSPSIPKANPCSSVKAKGGRGIKKIVEIEGAQEMCISPSSTDSGRSDGDTDDFIEEGVLVSSRLVSFQVATCMFDFCKINSFIHLTFP